MREKRICKWSVGWRGWGESNEMEEECRSSIRWVWRMRTELDFRRGGGLDFLCRRSVVQKDIYEERYQQQKTFSCARYPPDGRKKSGI